MTNAHTFAVLFGLPADPTADVSLEFPTGSTTLTAIADVTGNYTGETPTSKKRPYNISVAQDESGKLAAMGTVDGITQKDGTGTSLSGNIGAVTTVDGKPTASLKGSFSGTRDGAVASSKGSMRGPVELDSSNRANAIASGTATTVGFDVYKTANEPLTVTASTENAAKLKKSWGIDLKLENKVDEKTGKGQIWASADLRLPNGDIIRFAAKKVKYSTTKGYKVSLTKGMNITVNPNKLDSKTSVTITGMILIKEGEDWVPSAGTISYKFLGQKGSGNLMEFLEDA